MTRPYSRSEDLSPAARSALEAVAEEFRNELLLEVRSRNFYSDESSITVSDIVRTADDLMAGRRRGASRVKTLGRAYVLIGVTLAYFGTVGLIVLGDSDGFTSFPVAAAASIGGAVLAFVGASTFTLTWRRGHPDVFSSRGNDAESVQAVGLLVLDEWRAVESAARQVVSEQFGESHASEPLNQIVARLLSVGVLNRDDEQNLLALLSLRNQVVHDNEMPSRQQAVSCVRAAQHALEKILKARGNQTTAPR